MTMATRGLGDDVFPAVLGAAQSGDQEAFRALFRAHQPHLLRYLRALSGEDADDIAGDTWVNVVRGLRTFSGSEPEFRAWLFTIARRRRSDRAKAQRRRPAAVLVDPLVDPLTAQSQLDSPTNESVEDAVGEIISTEAALRLVRRLPREQAEVVLLRHLAGFDVAQTAEILGKTPGAVRILAHRGLRRLADELGGRRTEMGPVSRGVTR